jgi:hypothetical protein
MSDVVQVLIFFTGIIAFAPSAKSPHTLDAYLLNVDDHVKELVTSVDFLANPAECIKNKASVCSTAGKLCVCPLNNVTISLSTIADADLPPPMPSGSYVTDKTSGDISWLVRMARVNPNMSKLSKNIKIGSQFGGSLTFGWNEAYVCRFDEAECNGKRRVFAVAFPTGLVTEEDQPVPELVMFSSHLTSPVISVIGKSGRTDLTLKCPKEGCPILISNSMDPSNNGDTLCDDCGSDGGEHFKEYRRVAKNPVGNTPKRLCSSKQYVELEAHYLAECDPGIELLKLLDDLGTHVTAGDRIICPPTVFER